MFVTALVETMAPCFVWRVKKGLLEEDFEVYWAPWDDGSPWTPLSHDKG